MKVNIRKISELTGFSPATVSNALNHKRGVNARTAQKILQTAHELGYFDENRISKVKFVMFKKCGYIVEDTPFFPQMIDGAEKECRNLDMEMTICNLDKRLPSFDDQVRLLCEDRQSAVILLGTEMEDEDADLIRQLSLSVPFIVVDYWKEDMAFDAMLINNGDSARLATEYLIRKGHRSIGYLRGSFRIKPFRSRFAGYKIALEKAGIPLDEELSFTLSPTMDGAYADMKQHLENGRRLPTAFFADNDMIALGAMKALWECGYRIPDDVSVVGFDDLTYSCIANPPLTTLSVPKQEMGRAAVRRLHDKISAGDNFHMKMQACTEFVERQSVRELKS